MAVAPETAEIVRRKKQQYCRFMDSEQWEDLKSVALPEATFAFYRPDGSIYVQDGIECAFSSRETLVKFFSDNFVKLQTLHLTSHGELEQISPDEIKGVWGMIYHAGPKESSNEGHGTGGGHYFETWRRKDGDWFLADLKMKGLYWRG